MLFLTLFFFLEIFFFFFLHSSVLPLLKVHDDTGGWDDPAPTHTQGTGAGSSATAMSKASRSSSTGNSSSVPSADLAGKSLNRFSPFVKSGAEEFVLANAKNPGVEDVQLVITVSPFLSFWLKSLVDTPFKLDSDVISGAAG